MAAPRLLVGIAILLVQKPSLSLHGIYLSLDTLLFPVPIASIALLRV